tara:strand:+ start:85 stop:252 length:168 start_codon:yes stop_codon:yes gene_type:complete
MATGSEVKRIFLINLISILIKSRAKGKINRIVFVNLFKLIKKFKNNAIKDNKKDP